MILDDDLDRYAIIQVFSPHHFVFVYYFESGETVPEVAIADCSGFVERQTKGKFQVNRAEEFGKGDFVANCHSSVTYDAKRISESVH